ncbi:hypothetical protein, partial [Corynebacterium sp. CMW7794]|uniref:hypothetical protein n=1 Tax=Corynebacterium sp. CMW7794 TaxID=1603887 RepID=UPI001E62CA1F
KSMHSKTGRAEKVQDDPRGEVPREKRDDYEHREDRTEPHQRLLTPCHTINFIHWMVKAQRNGVNGDEF